MFTTCLLVVPGRRIPEVEEIKNASVTLFIVEEIAVLNVRVSSLLPIDGISAVNLFVELI